MKRRSVLLLVVLLFISMFTDVSTIVYATENETNLERSINDTEVVDKNISENSNDKDKIEDRAVDITAPILDVSSLKVDKKEATLGDSVKVSFKASDDISGIQYAWVYYKMPQTQKNKLIKTSYNTNTGLYEGSLTVDDSIESGKWEIDVIMLQDYQGNDKARE